MGEVLPFRTTRASRARASLTDQNATVEAIRAKAVELSANIEQGGMLFVIFIGHGAPGQGGSKGVLLGADARPSEASFTSRSIGYDQLSEAVAGGKQERTVMILDACFSGIANTGKTLLPDTQRVIAVNLVASAHTTVFSAGKAGEFAGALPGCQRPALSYLLLGAMRGWADSNGDGSITGTEAQAYASLVMRTLPNNHEQHPEMTSDAADKPLETNRREPSPDLATIRSKLDTWKPPTEEVVQPMLRVAVGCGDTVPRSVDDGLAIWSTTRRRSRSPQAEKSAGTRSWARSSTTSRSRSPPENITSE